MEPFQRLDAVAMPMGTPNVDTDQIIPARFLWRGRNDGWGPLLFNDLRFNDDGSEKPQFVLNRAEYRPARILVGDRNFGCGSSREYAVWSLYDYGFRAVIAPSFADIFRNNCLKIGLLPVALDADVVTRIMRAIEDDPTLEIVIDVVDRRVAVPAIDLDEPFELEDFHQYRLLEGLDDIGISLRFEPEITSFEAKRPAYTPRVV